MAIAVPFRGVRYNERITGDLGGVITPPYDVITAGEQEQFYRRSPYNFIRLEYGWILPGDGAVNNRYTRAAEHLESWLREGVLGGEEQPSFYLYRQSFTLEGRRYHRTGFFAALKLEPYSNRVILPHEETLLEPKRDRLELLRACRANFSPIFGLFSDPEQDFMRISSPLLRERPLFDFVEQGGQGHALWAVKRRPEQEALAQLLAPRQIFVADGHHRYDTALQYAQLEGVQEGPGRNYLLAVLVPLEDPGLVLLPFHRLLAGLSGEQLSLLLAKADQYFELEEAGPLEQLDSRRFAAEIALQGEKNMSLGLLLPHRAVRLALKGERDSRELDVSLLKKLLLDPIFDAGVTAEEHLDFVSDDGAARDAVLAGRAQAAFLLNSTPLEAVTARALRGENMPQKSTCFHPKLPGGLVIHHHDLSHRDGRPA